MSLPFQFDNSYLKLSKVFYSPARGHKTPSAQYALLNRDLAQALELDLQALESEEAIAYLSGNALPPTGAGIAMAYAGHQFGYFTMLGDGRALLLGEILDSYGNRRDIHLKGSGPTLYSRNGDGKAALGPMLREYLISEAMHALEIPTSRSLAVVTTGESVRRETPLQGAVLARVAASHLRVGTFQYAAALGLEDTSLQPALRELADYAIWRHDTELLSESASIDESTSKKESTLLDETENVYLAFYNHVVERQAQLVAQWQGIGFIHGVLNTDNTAISGETIDYGPCAFMDAYHPNTVFSSIDQQGRYAYHNQPNIIGWNLARLAETLMPLFHPDADQAKSLAEKAIHRYIHLYETAYHERFCKKLGISPLKEHEALSRPLIVNFLNLLQTHSLDFTESFIWLTLYANKDSRVDLIQSKYQALQPWLLEWTSLREQQNLDLSLANPQMLRVNPCIVPKNSLVEQALTAWTQRGDNTKFLELLTLLKAPYDYSDEQLSTTFSAVANSTFKGGYRTYCGT